MDNSDVTYVKSSLTATYNHAYISRNHRSTRYVDEKKIAIAYNINLKVS